MDSHPPDTTVDPSNRDSNKGMLTAQYEPYVPLPDATRELNLNAYQIARYFEERGTMQ